jgi:hypothetical protein
MVMGGEGPGAWTCKLTNATLLMPGCPPPHSAVVSSSAFILMARAYERPPVVLFQLNPCPACVLGLYTQTTPPWGLCKVAASTCLVAGVLHCAPVWVQTPCVQQYEYPCNGCVVGRGGTERSAGVWLLTAWCAAIVSLRCALFSLWNILAFVKCSIALSKVWSWVFFMAQVLMLSSITPLWRIMVRSIWRYAASLMGFPPSVANCLQSTPLVMTCSIEVSGFHGA